MLQGRPALLLPGRAKHAFPQAALHGRGGHSLSGICCSSELTGRIVGPSWGLGKNAGSSCTAKRRGNQQHTLAIFSNLLSILDSSIDSYHYICGNCTLDREWIIPIFIAFGQWQYQLFTHNVSLSRRARRLKKDEMICLSVPCKDVPH